MKKNETTIVLAVVAFIAIVGVLIYGIVMPLVHEEGHGEAHEEEKKGEGFGLLLKSAEFMKGKTAYQFTTQEKVGDVEKTFFVTQDGENAYIKETLLGISREVFYTENGSILCFDFAGERYCDLANETKEMLIVDGFRAALFSDKRAEMERKRFEILEKSGGLEIYSTEKSKASGKDCTLIEFKADYSKLSLSGLEEIGLSPSDPAVSLVPYYNLTYCIAENGEVLSKQISYVYKGQQIEEKLTIVNSDYESSNIPQLPQNFTDLASSFERHYNIFNEYFTCLGSYGKDKCIASVAVNRALPEMCEYAEDKNACYGAYVSFTLNPAICDKFEGELKDHCFFTIALGKKDESFCRSMANETLEQECIAHFKQNQTPSNQTE